MLHGLLGSGTVIDADVVALRLKLFIQNQFGTVKQGEQVAALQFRQVEKGANVPFGYQ